MQLILSILILAVTALVVYAIVRSGPRRAAPQLPASRPYQPVPPAEAPALHWSDDGHFLTEVVIESKFQPVLKQLAGGAQRYLATLVPDDANPYEYTAVTVFIEGQWVGQLSPKAALKLRSLLALRELKGKPSTCDAMIKGGNEWQGKQLSWFVVLDIEPLE
ncbi:MAG: hypothetical protein ACEQSK_02570 [Sphingomonadaceae bacterium]